MKDINEAIKVKRKPIECYSSKPNKQTTAKSFHIFSPLQRFAFSDAFSEAEMERNASVQLTRINRRAAAAADEQQLCLD